MSWIRQNIRNFEKTLKTFLNEYQKGNWFLKKKVICQNSSQTVLAPAIIWELFAKRSADRPNYHFSSVTFSNLRLALKREFIKSLYCMDIQVSSIYLFSKCGCFHSLRTSWPSHSFIISSCNYTMMHFGHFHSNMLSEMKFSHL